MTSSIPNTFSWNEVRPGRWERDIDEVEQFYTSLAKAFEGTGRAFFAMTGFISFSVPLNGPASGQETEKKVETALKKAWVSLRYDHPTIGSKVEYDLEKKKCRKVYETFSTSFSEQDWVNSTFRVINNGMSGLEWCNSDPPVPELPTIFLIKSPSPDDRNIHCDLVLRAHHDIVDGVGTLLLFNNLFAHASQAYEEDSSYKPPQFGDESVNLSPPLRVAAGIPPTLRPAQQQRMRGILDSNASLKKDVEIASPPFNKDQVRPGKHQRVSITLTEEQTAKVIAACSLAGLSVTHAYHTAVAITVRDVQERRQEERKVRYINYCLINERGHCDSPYSTRAHAASVYHSVSGNSLAIDLVVPSASSTAGIDRAKEFDDIVKIVREFYLTIRNDKEHIFLVPSYWEMSTIPYPVDGCTPPVPRRNETPSVSISSMGVIDNIISHKHGVFELDSPWVTGEELGTGIGVFLGTWKDRLTLSAAYNDAWHHKDEVLDFLERCNKTTMRGLGM